ncbi:MAG: PorT family protein [Bacteroidales bacterium]|nr:PorT family protein [Bacteroidales bacterium]
MKNIHFHPWILLLVLFPSVAFPQMTLPIKLGLKIAPNIGWMNPSTKEYSNDGARMGTTIGFVGDLYFAERYAFSTGFNFQFLNGMLNYPDVRLKPNDTAILSGEVTRKYHFLYLEIPLMIKMQTKEFGKFSFYGQIGFGTGFRLKVTANESFQPNQGESFDQKYDLNQATSLIRESILIGIGGEFHLDQSSRFFFGLSYSNSLNSVLTGVNEKSKMNEKSMLNYAELNLEFLF